MLNQQPIEKLEVHHDGSLEVVKIWETIQGEGPFAGERATFIRLAGCNLQCPLCDTDYTSSRRRLIPTQILHIVQAHRPKLVVLTGGEPMRQGLTPLLLLLLHARYIVQIETNGTYCDKDIPYEHPALHVVCSPKTGRINRDLEPYLAALKYVVQANCVAEDGLPTQTLGNSGGVARPSNMFKGILYVQPLDEQDEERNQANMAAAVSSCLQHGYRLCLQVHKIAGLP